jgi:hypothetical protein
LYWWNGNSDVDWSSNNVAALGAGSGDTNPYTLSIDPGGVSAAGILFQDQAYTISGSSLTLTSPAGISMIASGGTIASVLMGSSGLNLSGPGVLTLLGSDLITGGGSISGSTLQIGGGGNTGTLGTGNITDNGTLFFDRTDTGLTIAGSIGGTGNVFYQLGSGTVTGVNSYSGSSVINSGKLYLGSGGTSGSLGSGPVTDNGTLYFNRSDGSLTVAAIIGTGAVYQLGSGTTTLLGNNTYTGVSQRNECHQRDQFSFHRNRRNIGWTGHR